MRRFLNLREFGEALQRAGNDYGREIIDLSDNEDFAVSFVEVFDSIADTMDYPKPKTIADYEAIDQELIELRDVLDDQEHKAFAAYPERGIRNHHWARRFEDGINWLQSDSDILLDVRDILMKFGAIAKDDYETSVTDILRVLLL